MIGRLHQAQRLFSRGQRLVRQMRFEDALHAFDQALALQPRCAGIYLHRALALSESNRLPEARETLQRAIDLQPGNPVLPMFLGQIYWDHGDYQAAKACCERALSMSPHNYHAMALHTLTDLALGDIPTAYQRLTQPLRAASSTRVAGFLRGGNRQGLSVLHVSNAALQSRLLLLVETYLLQRRAHGRTLFQQQAEARTGPGATEHAPRLLRALDRGCTRVVMGVRRLGVQILALVQPAQKASALLRLAAAEAYYLGDLPTALSRYTQLQRQRPDEEALQQRLFEIAYEQGHALQALKHLTRLLQEGMSPAQLMPWQALYLGELYYQTGRLAEASRYLTHAVSLPVEDYRAFYYLGLCRLHEGARLDARRLFGRAMEMLNPDISRLRLEELFRVHRSCPSQHGYQPRV